MFNDLLTQITPVIQHYGAWGVFVISFIEEILPLPSTFSYLAAGFFLLTAGESFGFAAVQSISKIVIPGAMGLAIGSIFVYSVTYLGGEPFIRKWGKWFGVQWHDVEKMNKYFRGHWTDELTLFVLRSLPIIPNGIVSAVCGILKYPFKKLFIITFLGSCVRGFVLGMLGWSLGEAFVIYADQISEFGDYALYALLAVTAATLVYLFVRRQLKKRKVISG